MQSNLELYPFWKMQTSDELVVRFVPDLNEHNPFGFIDEYNFHLVDIDGKRKYALCSLVHEKGKACYHCATAKRSLERDGFNGNPIARKYWRKKQYTANVVIIKDPLGITDPNNPKTYKLQIGKGLFNDIKEALINSRMDTPTDYCGGYNFKITKKMYERWSKYEGTFQRKSKLTAEQIKLADGAIMDLSSLRPTLYSSTCNDELSKDLMWDILGTE